MKLGRVILLSLVVIAPYLQAAPLDEKSEFVRALGLAESGRNGEAIALLEALVKSHPRPEFLNNLAVLQAREGEFEKARETLMTVFDTDPAYAAAFANLKEIHAKLAGIAYAKALDTPAPQDAPRLTLLDRLRTPVAAPVQVAAVTPIAAPVVPAAPVAKPQMAKPQTVAPPVTVASAASVAPVVDLASAPPAPEAAPRRVEGEVLAVVAAWAKAWSAQDVEGYLARYATDFVPAGGETRAHWKGQRRLRIKRPSSIQVEVADPQVQVIGERQAEVTFVQSYRADHYQDRVRKRLVMIKVGSQWRIQREEVL